MFLFYLCPRFVMFQSNFGLFNVVPDPCNSCHSLNHVSRTSLWIPYRHYHSLYQWNSESISLKKTVEHAFKSFL